MYYGVCRAAAQEGIRDEKIDTTGYHRNPWWIVWKYMPEEYQNWSKDSKIFMHIMSAEKGTDANANGDTLASSMVQCIKDTLQFIAKNNIELK